MQITFNFSELWFIFGLGQPRSILKKHFPGHYILSQRKFNPFQGLVQEFKDFSMTPSNMQGLFKIVPTLETLTDQATKIYLHFF